VVKELEFNTAFKKMLSVEVFHTVEGYFIRCAVVDNPFGGSLDLSGKTVIGVEVS
jgi:hypothetical protein